MKLNNHNTLTIREGRLWIGHYGQMLSDMQLLRRQLACSVCANILLLFALLACVASLVGAM